MFFEQQSAWRGGFGISPHAPYTASPVLYELSRACATRYGMPWTTHVAESAEEMEMFVLGQGPLYDFLTRLGRDMSDTGQQFSPLRRILGDSGRLDGGILVHLNYLDETDWDLLRQWGPGMSVVHCPSSHRFFDHRPFPDAALRAAGAQIALATDSGATGGSLDLREELRLYQAGHPECPATELWKMVTSIPAGFLRKEKDIGQLRPGAHADFVVFHSPNAEQVSPDSLWQQLVDDPRPPLSVWVDGKPVAGRVSP
jgi:cytosine/adenosine deaminase-related metal-dependent hydrolase